MCELEGGCDLSFFSLSFFFSFPLFTLKKARARNPARNKRKKDRSIQNQGLELLLDVLPFRMV